MTQFEGLNPFHLKSIPWVKEGYFYQQAERPGKHPYHEAGSLLYSRTECYVSWNVC